MSTLNQVVMNLLEATVTLYPAKADGSPVLDSPIWTGAPAERLRARAVWLREESRPSGSRYPRQHPLVPQFQIEIGRVWLLNQSGATIDTGFQPEHGNYVLDITWVEEDTQRWHRKTFYGVTMGEQEWSARDIESGVLEEQSFLAQYQVPASGGGSVPDVSATLPCWVQYTAANGQRTALYAYDPATGSFTALTDVTGMATIGYTAGAFSIQFAGDSQPVVSTLGAVILNYRSATLYRTAAPYRQTAGLVIHGSVFTGVPLPMDWPRLDFFYGNQRVFSVTRQGVYNLDFSEGNPASVPTGAFGIANGSGGWVAVASAKQLVASQFEVSD